MRSKEVIFKIAATSVFALSVFLFFRLVYPYHLHYQEQYQLFLFSTDYLISTISIPGGVSDYLSRFFIQFFYYAGFGAGFITALAVVVQLSVFAVCTRKTLTEYALSFIPAGLLVIYMCDENALLSPFVATAAGLSFTYLLSRSDKKGLRWIRIILLEILLYLTCGNIAVLVFSVVAVCREKNWKLALVCGAVSVASAYMASHFFNFPFTRLMFGTNYHRFHNVEPLWPWLSALSAAFIVLGDSFVSRRTGSGMAWVSTALYILVIGLSAGGISLMKDSEKEEMMRYIFFTHKQMWNRIIKASIKKSPDLPMTVSCLNLALAMKGEMGEHMFEFYQNGIDGLFPPYQRDHVSPMPTSDVYWHLGFINSSKRFSFAAQEVIPDFQKSARCYQRMVEANIVNGAYDVARKYLEPLKYTLFYRKWALENENLLNHPEVIDRHPVYARQRSIMLKKNDFMYSEYEMDSMLGLLYLENRTNQVAMQYLLAWTLLSKNLSRFYDCFQMHDGKVMKSYQEGVLLYWAEKYGRPEGMPSYISESVYNRFLKFMKDYHSCDKSYMEKYYSDTYWFYYYYRSN